jgi:hypothetical protein
MPELNTQFPSWMTQRQGWQQESDNAPQLFWQGVEGALAIQKTKSALLSQAADRQFQYAQLAEKQKEDAAFAQDAPAIASWMAGITKDSDTPPPTVTSAKGLQLLERQQNWKSQQDNRKWMQTYREEALKVRQDAADNNTLAAKLAVKDGEDFIKQMDTVDPATRAKLRAMKPNKDGSPSAEQWALLDAAPKISAKPLSPLGKLTTDYEAGRIDDATFQAEVAKMTAQKATPTKPDYADAAKIKGLQKSISEFENDLAKNPEDNDAAAEPDSVTAKLRKANYDLKALEAKLKKPAGAKTAPAATPAQPAANQDDPLSLFK